MKYQPLDGYPTSGIRPPQLTRLMLASDVAAPTIDQSLNHSITRAVPLLFVLRFHCPDCVAGALQRSEGTVWPLRTGHRQLAPLRDLFHPQLMQPAVY